MRREPLSLPGEAQRSEGCRQPDPGEMLSNAIGIRDWTKPSLDREIEGEHAAERHRLAVQQPVGVARLRLERMAEGMTEVEPRAPA